jgi:hypothetical protein
MKDVHEKLAVWARLSKECEQLKARLSREPAKRDAHSMAEYETLQARTRDAFKDASEAIKSTERSGPPAGNLRSRQMALGG